MIFSRTVKLNPLAVLVAILLGVELAGILGALLAIPVAGIIQVVLRDVWDHRRGRPKDEPTLGEDRTPVDHANPGTADRPKSPGSSSRRGNTIPTPRNVELPASTKRQSRSACHRSGPNTSYWMSRGATPCSISALRTACRNGIGPQR